MGSRALQDIKGVMSMVFVPVPLVLQGAGGHDGRHRAAKAQHHGDEGPARQAQPAHNAVHDVGHPGHVAAVLQKGQGQEQDEDVGQEGEDPSYAGDDAVHQQGDHRRRDVQRLQSVPDASGEKLQACLEVALEPVADGEGEEEHQGHDDQEDGQAQPAVDQEPVGLVGDGGLPVLVHQHLLDDLVDEVVLLVDDVLFVAPVQHVGQVHRVLGGDFLVPLQKLEGVPAVVLQIGVLRPQGVYHQVNLVLQLVGIHHGVLRVVMVPVLCLQGLGLVLPVVVDQGDVVLVVLVVGRGVHQDVQAGLPPGGHGDHRDAQHLREPVGVDLHAPLLHDVHHVQGQDHRVCPAR